MPNYGDYRQGLCATSWRLHAWVFCQDMAVVVLYRVGALEGYDTCHWVMELLTALQHSCILLSLIARRHEHAL